MKGVCLMLHPPNILLIMTDQQRGDCLGVDGHPVLQTPRLDALAASGTRFRRAYSACPLCMPARRTLMTGMTAAHHGLVGNVNDISLDYPTLPGVLRDAGYQTHLVGKLHLFPLREPYGFGSTDWSDGPYRSGGGDYLEFLDQQCPGVSRPEKNPEAPMNSWLAAPWHLDDDLHFTNWATDRALAFLDGRDRSKPFFLKVSYFHPHTPCTPPAPYFDHYMQQDLGEPTIGDWARISDKPILDLPPRSKRLAISAERMKRIRAGYFGCIEHLDDQIGRVLDRVKELDNLIVVFVSDHGEMLGDHQYFQKGQACEGSARIPFLMTFPDTMGIERGQVRDEPVELMDVMPTLLDAAACAIPDTVDGQSLLPLLCGKLTEWRQYLHGECAHDNGGAVYEPDLCMHYITDGQRKYVWRPDNGRELFFDIQSDPTESNDLSNDAVHADELSFWRQRLVEQLADRPEGFSDGRLLIAQGRTPLSLLPSR